LPPHAPQLFGSVWVFVQAPLQFVSPLPQPTVPAGHNAAQAPPTHACPVGHA